MIQGLNLTGARDPYLLENFQMGCGASPASCPVGTGFLSWGKMAKA